MTSFITADMHVHIILSHSKCNHDCFLLINCVKKLFFVEFLLTLELNFFILPSCLHKPLNTPLLCSKSLPNDQASMFAFQIIRNDEGFGYIHIHLTLLKQGLLGRDKHSQQCLCCTYILVMHASIQTAHLVLDFSACSTLIPNVFRASTS